MGVVLPPAERHADESDQAFLKMFNSAKRQQVLFPNSKMLSPGMIQKLREVCTFDDPGLALPDASNEFTGARYLAAEKFWSAEFREETPLLESTLGLSIVGSKAERAAFWGFVEHALASALEA